MRSSSALPDKQTAGYYLLEIIAVSGELPASQLRRLYGGESYKLNLIKLLKSQKLLRTYYRDGLRGYRLTAKAKENLLSDNPGRFSFALTGTAETNRIKSEITRRLRLHRIAEATVTMMNADVLIFRDEKPDVFSPVWDENSRLSVKAPVFYNSREIKEIGTVFVKIRGARSVGVLLTPADIFVVYNLGNAMMKWEYKSEMRTKALMKTVLCRERLPQQYTPDAVQGLILGNGMDLAYDILKETGSNQYFVLDGNYENFFYLTNDRRGESLLRLLCSRELTERLDNILLTDLYESDSGSTLENDAFDKDGNPVLFGYFCNLPRIRRFDTALLLQNKKGTLICFDFQREVLERYCSKLITFQTIDFQKWERSFFE
ncbi:MAG: hypothetical protein ACI39E_06010 [Acutalibacteraceae bacterium]